MRRHLDGRRTNQRELDVIVNEVIPEFCADVAPEDIGVTTPYRGQASKATDMLIDEVAALTVHKFQGREKRVVMAGKKQNLISDNTSPQVTNLRKGA